jgi:hypothetical protein
MSKNSLRGFRFVLIFSLFIFFISTFLFQFQPLAEAKSDNPCSEKEEHQVIGKGQESFCLMNHRDQYQYLLSQDCLNSTGSENHCEARKAFKRVKKIELQPKDFEGGREPGSMLCLKLGAQVIISVDARKNQVSHCRFSDGSSAETSALVYFHSYD